MPKIKTLKSAAKRFRKTATGKIIYKKQGLRHILIKKSSKRKRHLRQQAILSPSEQKRIQRMLPYK